MLDAILKTLCADAQFTYREGRTHLNLYAKGADRLALIDAIAAQMYLVAYPGTTARWRAVAVQKFPN